jgi:hypothetical protein
MNTSHPTPCPPGTRAAADGLSRRRSDPGEEADKLLEAAEMLGVRRGVYSDSRLTRKIRREDRKERVVHAPDAPDQTAACVVEQWLDDLIEVGGLMAIEEICFRLYFAGRAPSRIATDLRLSYRRVCRRLRSARAKLRRAYRQGPYAGWQEVYLAEVHRCVYRARRTKRT